MYRLNSSLQSPVGLTQKRVDEAKERIEKMEIGEAVSSRIFELCNERHITINNLCTISGVTQSTVNNIISGRNRSTTVSTVKKLCDGLDITLGEFFAAPIFDELEQEIK